MKEKVKDMLEDIKHIMKNAVLIAPRIYEPKSNLSDIEKDIDIFHLQQVNDLDYIIDKIEYLCAKYRNIYIIEETHPFASALCGTLAKPNWLEGSNFECNLYYLYYDKITDEYLPLKINEDL